MQFVSILFLAFRLSDSAFVFVEGLCNLDIYLVEMAGQQQALANALRSLRGIHNTGERFKKAAEKGAVGDCGSDSGKGPGGPIELEGEESAQELVRRSRKRKAPGVRGSGS